jgi:hypothetical protein
MITTTEVSTVRGEPRTIVADDWDELDRELAGQDAIDEAAEAVSA